MSGVLKSGSSALGTVRPLAFRAPEPARPDPELERLRAALADAEAALADRGATIAGIPERIEAAFAAGEEQGRAAAEDREAERLAALGEAIGRALDLYAKEMASLERLAALLARTCLDRMLLADEARIGTVAGLLRGRLAALEADAVVRIRVSAEDFQSTEALTALAPAPCEIDISHTLAPGDCTIQLILGGLDVGIGQQWGTLRAALGEMAA